MMMRWSSTARALADWNAAGKEYTMVKCSIFLKEYWIICGVTGWKMIFVFGGNYSIKLKEDRANKDCNGTWKVAGSVVFKLGSVFIL